MSVVENLLPNYNFQYVLPEKNKCGGVGIYTCGSLTDVIVKDHVKFVKSCDCTKYETESLFIEFCYRGIAYTVGGIYRHPNGNVSHFISDLEIVLNQVDNDKTTVVTGDINIDIIKNFQWGCCNLYDYANVLWLFALYINTFASNIFLNDMHWSHFYKTCSQRKSFKHSQRFILLWHKWSFAMLYIH